MVERKELFQFLVGRRSEEVVIHTMSTKSDWPAHSDHPLDFFVQGAMGYASSVALGVALSQPTRRVWVIDGDGSLLMNLATLATIARARPKNLVHILLENGVYELTGRVPTPGAGVADFCSLAKAAGIADVGEVDTPAEMQDRLPAFLENEGPVFVSVHVADRPREPMGSSALIKRAPEAAAALHAYFAESAA
jgi:thiamine pyrophosphate-dependent acetolactate synthase large subunit-like protein